MSHAEVPSSHEGAELVLALVSPVGTELDPFGETLGVCLEKFQYRTNAIRLSDLASSFRFVTDKPEPTGTEYFVRVTKLMNAGNAARRQAGGDILSLAAAAKIHRDRPRDERGEPGPRPKTAHVIRSLKNPGEVQALRRIYGPGFFLIGVVASKDQRRAYLGERKGCTPDEIKRLLKRDDHEDGDEFGQRTRDTFHLADVFLSLEDTKGLSRFLRLVFGHPHETPTRDEHAMFLAFAAALRSADLSRQVGAVVQSATGDVVAVGTNDVPSAGGGLCWPGKGDFRDHVLGRDMNEAQRRRIVNQILKRLRPRGVEKAAWEKRGWAKLKGAAVMDITEYGRAVHAEMDALLSCARSGVSPKGATLFSTTFPCHNCAKHIVAAGVSRVVYVEPYPKSQAFAMYHDALTRPGSSRKGVLFEPFQGVGPRRFFDLFSVGLSSGYPVKRKDDGRVREWDPSSAELRVPLVPTSYIRREATALEKLARWSQKG